MSTHQDYSVKKHHQQGVTLVELMIALVISSIVLIGVGTVYITSKRSYLIQEEYARMQENARFAFQFLSQDIRQAGYAGCNPIVNNLLASNSSTSTGTDDDLFDFNRGIYGWEFDGTDPGDAALAITGSTIAAGKWSDHNDDVLHEEIAGNALDGSDVVVIKSAEEMPDLVPSGNTPPNNSQVNFPDATGIEKGQLVMISDCRTADLFVNQSGPAAVSLNRAGNCPQGTRLCNQRTNESRWHHTYNAGDVRILRATSRGYFIGEGKSGEPALFRIDYDHGDDPAPQELVEGVENMQILYGVDKLANSTFEASQYLPFDQLGDDIDNVVSVRISLLMRTAAELDRPLDDNVYSLLSVVDDLDVDIDPVDDRRLRKVFTTTIALRNKMVSGRRATR